MTLILHNKNKMKKLLILELDLFTSTIDLNKNKKILELILMMKMLINKLLLKITPQLKVKDILQLLKKISNLQKKKMKHQSTVFLIKLLEKQNNILLKKNLIMPLLLKMKKVKKKMKSKKVKKKNQSKKPVKIQNLVVVMI